MKDQDYDTSKIDIKEYTRLHIKCQELFSDMDTDSPDLRELRDLGGKMINGNAVHEFQGANGKIMRIDNDDLKRISKSRSKK